MTAGFFHQPVLLQPVFASLKPSNGKRFLDATIGGGGHTRSLLDAGAQVLGLDQDMDAIRHIMSDAAFQPALAARQLVIEKSNFIHAAEICKKHHFVPLDGVIADLGVSSYQFDMPSRGFSFRHDGPLDMRMDTQTTLPVSDYLNLISETEIARLLELFGEVPQAKQLAKKIAAHRPIDSTFKLAKLIPPKLVAQVFQAFRIAVNDELGALQLLLEQLPPICRVHATICIITFHSLEDRIVKHVFQDWSMKGWGSSQSPIEPDAAESLANGRARSSKLRVFTFMQQP